jgi:uncharacterized protein
MAHTEHTQQSELEIFRAAKNEFFRKDPQSPLTPDQRREFSGLKYFPENPALNLELPVEVFAEKDKIQMQTSTGDIQTYTRYGRVHFEVDGQPAELTVYSDRNGFFLPFVDSLASKETYGAGRYLEPEVLAGGKLGVDFNVAYNPYCAYNDLYSCPLTPFENHLKVPIRAGEKLFHAPDETA